MVEHVVRSPKDLQSACDAVSPGDVILVHGGAYPGDKPAKLHDPRGTPEHPVIIRAADDDWISGGASPDPQWGGGDPKTDPPRKPLPDDFAFLSIDDCAYLVIDGLKLRDFWPS